MRISALAVLIRRNLRKRRGQAIAMVGLALLAGALLNLGLIMATSYHGVVTDKLADASAADVSALLPAGDGTDRIVATARQTPAIRQVEAQPVLAGFVDVTYDGTASASIVVLADLDRPPSLGTWRVVSSTPAHLERPIWAPQIYDTAGGYDLGDPITFTSPSGSATFEIQGFIEHPTLGMPSMGAVGFAVPHAEFASLAASPDNGLRPMTLVKANATGNAGSLTLLQGLIAEHNQAHPQDPVTSLVDSSRELMVTGATIGSSIFAGGFIMFAAIIVLLSLVVMRFLLVNAITDDLRGLGVLRACGWTTGGVMAQLAATFLACAVAGALAGVASSYVVLPALAGALSNQTGLIWRPGFQPWAALLTLAADALAVLVVALLATRRLRRQPTISAVRGGAQTHTFTRNPLPLDAARGGLNVLLGLKSAVQRLPQQVLAGVTVLVVAFTTVIAVGLSVNVLGNSQAYTQLIIGDFPDGQIAMRSEAAAAAMMREAAGRPGVERAFLSTSGGATLNGYAGAVQVMDDYAIQRFDSTAEGRMPRHADEVALGAALASRLGVGVGDRVDLDINGFDGRYLVSGITSSSRSLGLTVDLTTAGVRRADPAYRQDVVALHVAEGADIDAILRDLARSDPADVDHVVNTKASIESQLSGFKAMVGALSNIIIAFMAVLGVLVVALVVSTMVLQTRRTFGVLKAVGFTSRDLHRQTLLTWVPVMALGALLGAVLGLVALNPSLGLMLRFVGITRADFTLPWWTAPALAVAVTVLAAVVVRLAARGLARVSAYALVTE